MLELKNEDIENSPIWQDMLNCVKIKEHSWLEWNLNYYLWITFETCVVWIKQRDVSWDVSIKLEIEIWNRYISWNSLKL